MEEVLSHLNSSKKVKGNFFLSGPIDIYESNAKRQRNRENIATLGEKKWVTLQKVCYVGEERF